MPDKTTMTQFDDRAVQVIGRAIEELDTAWDFDAARGIRDDRGGSEYRRLSTAHELRRLLFPDADERWDEQARSLAER